MKYSIDKLPAVLEARARGRTTHFADIAEGLFTRPVSLGGRSVGWPRHEVETLNAARISGMSDEGIRHLVSKLEAERKELLCSGGAAIMSYRERYVHHCEPCSETITRDRRLTLFEEISGLREVPIAQASHMLDKLKDIHIDHVSAWKNGEVTFVLNEPYYAFSTSCAGLSCIKLPANLSPYCGRWNPDKGAVPGTTSWLYVESEHAQVLFKLANALNCAAHDSPPWNWV